MMRPAVSLFVLFVAACATREPRRHIDMDAPYDRYAKVGAPAGERARIVAARLAPLCDAHRVDDSSFFCRRDGGCQQVATTTLPDGPEMLICDVQTIGARFADLDDVHIVKDARMPVGVLPAKAVCLHFHDASVVDDARGAAITGARTERYRRQRLCVEESKRDELRQLYDVLAPQSVGR